MTPPETSDQGNMVSQREGEEPRADEGGVSQSQPCGASKHAAPEAEPSAVRWPAPGEKMRFLGKNGYDFELSRAADRFAVGAILTVANCDVGSWSHSIEFREDPGKRWNGVMFERLTPAEPRADDGVVERHMLSEPAEQSSLLTKGEVEDGFGSARASRDAAVSPGRPDSPHSDEGGEA